MIISISGKANSGKDLVGKIIQWIKSPVDQQEGWKFNINDDYTIGDWEIKKFADKLKDIVCILLGCTREDLENEKFKNRELGEEWWYCVADDGSHVPYEQDLHEYKVVNLVKLTPRKLLQLLGTECGREIIHPNIWVNVHRFILKHKNHKETLFSEIFEFQSIFDKNNLK